MEDFNESSNWDPMQHAFDDAEFNSYRISDSVAALPTAPSAIVELFIAGIPSTLTETGLRNLLASVVQVHRINLVQHRGIGFVSVPRKDAVKVIAYFNNYKFGDNFLTVKFSTKPKRQAETDQSSTVSQSVTNSRASTLVDELKVPGLLYPSIAKYLEEGEEFTVEVSNVVSPSQFWVCRQPHDPKSQLKELHAKMQQHYSSLPPKTGFRPNGSGLYAGPMKESGNWCRVQALKFDTASVLVLCLDFGTSEELQLTDLHSLEGQFLTVPFQSLCCSLTNVRGTPQWSLEAANCVRQLVANKQVRLKVCSIDGYMLSVELTLSSGQTVADVLVERNHASHVAARSPKAAMSQTRPESRGSADVKGPSTSTRLNHVAFTVGERYDVIVLDLRSPEDATVMLKDNKTEFLTMIEELNSYSKPSGMHVGQVGEVVAAQFLDDCAWYRAEVQSLDSDDTAVVHFVDFGNYATVSLNSVMKLHPKHLSLPVFGVNVRFENLPMNSEVLSEVRDLCLKVIGKRGNQYVVELAENDSESPSSQHHYSISDIVQLSLKTDRTYKAFVTDGTEPGKFYMHVSTVNYTPIEELLQTIYSVKGGGYYPQEAGELVAIHLDEDDSWYRAIVCKVESSREAVICQLLDFGMVVSTKINNIGQFDSQLLIYPVISVKCWFHDATVSSANVWKYDCLRPMTTVYTMKVIEIHENLHYIELVDNESNMDLKQKLIADGILVKGRPNRPSKLQSAEHCKLSSDDNGQSLKVSVDTYADDQLQLSTRSCELQPMLASLSDAEINQLCQMRERVFVVHANNPCDFCITSAAGPAQKRLAELQKSIDDVCNRSLCEVTAADVGQIVGVYLDGVWHRAEVLDSDCSSGKFRVRLVDIGVTKTCRSAELRPLPHDLAASLPRQAIHCAIDQVVGSNADGSWSSTAVEWFHHSCVNHHFRLKFIFKNDSGSEWLLDLFDEATGRSVKEVLIAQKLAVSKASHSSKPGNNVSNAGPASADVSRKQQVRVGCVPVLLCSAMKSSSIAVNETVTVTFMHSPSKFSIQKQDQRCPEVLRELNSHCNEHAQDYCPKQVGELVAVLQKDRWYRGEVLEVGASTANVYFIDYGNTIVNVDFKHIRVLPLHFATALPKLAISCAIDGVTGTQGDGTYSQGTLRWFRDNYLRLTCTVTDARHSSAKTTLLIDVRNSESIKTARELMLHYDMARDTVLKTEETNLEHKSQAEMLTLTVDISQSTVSRGVVISERNTKFEESAMLRVGATVCIVHVVSPIDFYVMPADPAALQEMLSLSHRLSEYCRVSGTDQRAAYSPPFVHQPVAAKFEGEWFRAEVVKVLADDRIEVFFVDYGNTEVVRMTDVRKLCEDFVKKPKEAVHCGIDGIVSKEPERGFTQAATEWFEAKFCCGLNASVTFVRIGTGRKHMVDLGIDGMEMSAKELLVASGLAKYSVSR